MPPVREKKRTYFGTYRLRSSQIPIRFVTNTTKESGKTLYQRLKRIGFELDPSEIFSSLSAASAYVVKQQLRPLYLLTDDARGDFPSLLPDDELNAVVVGLAPNQFNYDTLNKAFRYTNIMNSMQRY